MDGKFICDSILAEIQALESTAFESKPPEYKEIGREEYYSLAKYISQVNPLAFEKSPTGNELINLAGVKIFYLRN